MIFKKLHDTLSENASVVMIVTKVGDELTVTLKPVANIRDSARHLIMPISITDVPEGVDRDLTSFIKTAIPKVSNFADNVKIVENSIAEAEKAAAEKKAKGKVQPKAKEQVPTKKEVPTKEEKPQADLFNIELF